MIFTRNQEKEKIRRLLAGEKEAGDWLVETHYPDLYRLLRFLTCSEEAAQDLTQQTFMAGWTALPGFRSGSSLRTWLHRIGYHEYARWRKLQPSDISIEVSEEISGVSGLPGVETLALERALLQLPEEQREVFLLHHLQGLSVSEIAEVQNVSGGTIKSRLFAARKRLRTLMTEEPPHKQGNGDSKPIMVGIEGGKR